MAGKTNLNWSWWRRERGFPADPGATGLSPAERSALISHAKRIAVPVTSCVAANLAPAHLLAGLSRDELLALVVVLADCAEPGRVRAVVAAEDDGRPSPSGHDLRLRAAHREFERMRVAYEDPPVWLRRLEAQYQAMSSARRREQRKGRAS